MLTAQRLAAEFRRVRGNSLLLCEPLDIEDYCLQGMADASPPKWHLAHTTWFFDTFVLRSWEPDYQPWDASFEHLFNSYYNGVGVPFNRPQRGLLSRPTLQQVRDYRFAIEERVLKLLNDAPQDPTLQHRVELGLHHEQQHQELLLTDIKYSFGLNPLLPGYQRSDGVAAGPGGDPGSAPVQWCSFEGGVASVGHRGEGFSFDNETPAHRQFIEPFALADRPVSNADFLQFIVDQGYSTPSLWLSDGWDWLQEAGLQMPLYWREGGDAGWLVFTLMGEQELQISEPVCHLSYYEADAFARWAGARLPTEFEWECAAAGMPVTGNFVDSHRYHPQSQPPDGSLQQLFGDVWEWTSSSYSPYPGFKPGSGVVGEYNGKFMCNQQVLRGGSCASDGAHIRATYRNFFYPQARWQFSGLRLAKCL